MASESQWVVETSDDAFDQDVNERSQERLVVVDFWADWCAPCRALGPVLESLAADMEGKFVLVKANTEHTQASAGQYGVSSIPAVFAVYGGKVIDAFQGALPESAIREWLTKCFASVDLEQALKLSETNPTEAEKLLTEIKTATKNDSRATIGLLELYAREGRHEEARTLLGELQERGFLEPEAEKVQSMLDLQESAGVSLDEISAKAKADPKDLPLQLEFAQALAGAEQYEECFEICLNLVAIDRQQTGEEGRKLMLKIFQVLPEDSEVTREYRRRLSLTLY